ncbi:MAG: cyclic peptide export ABC transporter [Verrucomicrobia bacterium]|nr:cyclic peptide export ABC transporter [Verrucomicrobiota bacterium]
MNLVCYLFRTARGMMLFTLVTALLSGACNAGLIALINQALNRGETTSAALAGSFVGLALGRLLTTFGSAVVLAKFAQAAIAGLRCDLVKKILTVPLRHLEEIGAARVMVVLTEDVLNIAQALLGIPAFAVNVAILFCGGLYLAWLSLQVLVAMGVFILVGALVYRSLIVSGFRFLMDAREEEDRLFGHFRALTDGVKELKLHRSRRGAFLASHIETATGAYGRHNVAAEVRFAIAHSWNHLLVLGVIGLILFVLPAWQHFNPQALTGYVVTTLYLMGPLAGVMGSLSVFGRASASLAKVEKLGMSLAAHTNEVCPLTRPEPNGDFSRLELAGVTRSYQHEKDDSNFMFGPVNLAFRPGEVVFLVGGNGSGKTTLAKIITGLYPPESGEIRLDGRPITDANRDDYRQLFSAVFADFFLFEDLLGLHAADLDAQARDYLAQLHLDHKVRVRDGRLSTTKLSQGQRKRLALLTAYLEDRPFYVFDEWASDQDPLFKELFYTQLLPELKARGKAVLVITHDEPYFQFADRLLKLDYGKLRGAQSRDEQRVRDTILQA